MVRSLKGHSLPFTPNGMKRRTGRGMTESEGQGYLPGLPNRAGNTETGGAASLPVSSLPCISLSPTFTYSFSDSLKELYHLAVYTSGIFCDSLHLDKFLHLPSNLSDLEVSGPDTLLAVAACSIQPRQSHPPENAQRPWLPWASFTTLPSHAIFTSFP